MGSQAVEYNTDYILKSRRKVGIILGACVVWDFLNKMGAEILKRGKGSSSAALWGFQSHAHDQ